MESFKFNKHQVSEEKGDYEVNDTKVINLRKKRYFKGNVQKILEAKVSDEEFQSYCRYAILKYAKEKNIGKILPVLDSMYYYQIEQSEFIKWCVDLFNDKYSLDEQADKFMKMYKENYNNGFEPYIR